MEGLHGLTHVFNIPLALWVSYDIVCVYDLRRITVASCPCHSQAVLCHIEYHVVLAHESPTKEHFFRSVKAFHCDAVLVELVAEEILAREPLKCLHSTINCGNMKSKDRIADKVIFRTRIESLLIVVEANDGFVFVADPFPFAMVLEIKHAEPIKVITDYLEQLFRNISEGRP